MKITKLETLLVKPRWCFLKVYTDEGIVGYGEPIVEGKARTVAQAVHELEHHLLGKDPRRIQHHWQSMYRHSFYRGGPVLTSAISGIEQALWDILGKWLGVPVYQLLGGKCRDRIRLYAHCGGRTPQECAENARKLVSEGFTALKMGLGVTAPRKDSPLPSALWNVAPIRIVDRPSVVDQVVERVGAIRDAVGRDVDLAVDFHGQTSPAMAIRLAQALEQFDLMFIEEPCLPENVDALAKVARATSIPVATGERLFTKWGFREVLEKQAASVLQPDLCHAGGIFECRTIAAMAEVYYAGIAPHNPLGPISLAACVQLDACIPNFLVQEFTTLGEGYLKEPFKMVSGYVEVPEGPGLGIELDDEAVEDKLGHDWRSPMLFHEDGSVGDW